MTVVGPSLRRRSGTFTADIEAVYAASAGHYDLVNLHCYPGGGRPAEEYLEDTLAELPPGPAIITEAGTTPGSVWPGRGRRSTRPTTPG